MGVVASLEILSPRNLLSSQQLLHLKHLEYVARLEEEYEWMTERTRRV